MLERPLQLKTALFGISWPSLPLKRPLSTPIWLLLVTTLVLILWFYLDFCLCHLNDFFRPLVIEVLKILDKNDIRSWLGGGAVLGLYRSGDLLAWDYDVDIYLEDVVQLEKIVALRPVFEEVLKLSMYTRDDVIWDKFNGDTPFHIEIPALRLYTKRYWFVFFNRFFIEFFDGSTRTLRDAQYRTDRAKSPTNKKKQREDQYMVPRDYKTLSNDTVLWCNEDCNVRKVLLKDISTPYDDTIVQSWRHDRCLKRDSVYPLVDLKQAWVTESGEPVKTRFDGSGVILWVPNDTHYVCNQYWGDGWSKPDIKGWKCWLCFQFWDDFSFRCTMLGLLLWYLFLIYWHYRLTRDNKFREKAVDSRSNGTDNVQLSGLCFSLFSFPHDFFLYKKNHVFMETLFFSSSFVHSLLQKIFHLFAFAERQPFISKSHNDKDL
ncbi:hypothetical protein RFI_00088 [Reticulomyxa filosa]|uniref:LicD/FKTN/FKRP nucleotidyltransferase domain-containing protein n=1 Tax=Reticulomyxa filosa TaxID=46433 RepID=X6PFJ2_RETFI|nr:hypothetical protein RFI_00088 [Reticulomyxa filosa]|eukprot:ETO36976.1 hypothetical protein RFI_00088 [Reticulomyxa filosa]